MTNAPAMKLRDGTIQATVWRNTSTSGQTFYSVSITRSYRNGDDTWRQTESLTQDDLLAAAELLREAYSWIKMQKRADAKGRKEADQVTAK